MSEKRIDAPDSFTPASMVLIRNAHNKRSLCRGSGCCRREEVLVYRKWSVGSMGSLAWFKFVCAHCLGLPEQLFGFRTKRTVVR